MFITATTQNLFQTSDTNGGKGKVSCKRGNNENISAVASREIPLRHAFPTKQMNIKQALTSPGYSNYTTRQQR
jgi:hypothetical protein